MKDLLFIKKLHLPLFTSEKSSEKFDEDLKFEHIHVCRYIRQFVIENVYNHIANIEHARTLLEKLESCIRRILR